MNTCKRCGSVDFWKVLTKKGPCTDCGFWRDALDRCDGSNAVAEWRHVDGKLEIVWDLDGTPEVFDSVQSAKGAILHEENRIFRR
jgi:ribosomal protein L37E